MNTDIIQGDQGTPPSARELGLIDKVIGLEARITELEGKGHASISEQLSAEHRLSALTSSTTWRAGHIITSPLRFIRRRLRGTAR